MTQYMMVGIQTAYKKQKCMRFFSVVYKDSKIEELQRVRK